MTIEQAHAAAAKFREQLAQASSPAPVTDATTPAPPIAGPRSFVRASTIGALPARIEAFERTLGQLTRDVRSLQQEFDEIAARLRRFDAAIATALIPAVGMARSGDTAVAAEPVDGAITQSSIVPPLLSVRPTEQEVKSAVNSYYNAQISVGVKPTLRECCAILQRYGYWPVRSLSFIYSRIRPFWPTK